MKHIFYISHLNMVIVKFAEEKHAKSALSYSEETGFFIHSNNLCVTAVHK